jgi:DNA-directed RNA polymerase I, II, and III subunit RPABC2
MADEYEDPYGDDGEEEVFDDGLVDEEGAEIAVDPAAGPKPSTETQVLLSHHPEIWVDYSETIQKKLKKGDTPPICYPFLNQFEKTKVLSFRASQLAQGSKPYIAIPDEVTDVYIIAKMELKEKKLPFIIKRPLPDGDYEYWRLSELMVFD